MKDYDVQSHEPLPAEFSWGSVLAMAAGTFTYVTTEFLPVGVLPEVAKSFNITTGDAGLMVTLPGILAALGAPAVLLLSGNLNRRLVIVILSLMLVISCGMSAVSTQYIWMLFSRAMFGFGLGGFWSLAIAIPSQLVSEKSIAKATAVIFSGVSLGMIVGVPFGTFISEIYGWRASFITVGVIGALAVAAQITYLPSLASRSGMKLHDLISFSKVGKARISLLLTAFLFIGHFSAYTYVAPLLIQSGVPAEAVTYVLLGFGVIGLLANSVAARFLPHKVNVALFMIAMLMVGVMVSLSLTNSVKLSVITSVLIWGGAWGALPLCMSTYHRLVDFHHEEASAVMLIFIIQIAIAIGSSLGGYLADSFGLKSVFSLSGGLYIIFLTLLIMSSSYLAKKKKKITVLD